MDTSGRRRPLVLGTRIAVIALVAALATVAIWAAVVDEDGTPKADAVIHFTPLDRDPEATIEGDTTGTPVPETTFAKLGGGTGTLADYKGKRLVVNFFASWCVPCRKEMPDIEKVHQALGDDVVVLGVSVRDSDRDTASLVRSTGVTYDIGRDPSGKLFSDLGGFNMPSTFLVSPQGKVVQARAGQLDQTQLRKLIADAFGEK
jgi:thiol-disulfide isomerase/thioredoxin